jgi:hypothetical protein
MTRLYRSRYVSPQKILTDPLFSLLTFPKNGNDYIVTVTWLFIFTVVRFDLEHDPGLCIKIDIYIQITLILYILYSTAIPNFSEFSQNNLTISRNTKVIFLLLNFVSTLLCGLNRSIS